MAKKKPYKTLSLEERVQIAYMLNDGRTITEIAKSLERSKSTITREIEKYAVDKPSKKNNCQFYVSHTCQKQNLCNERCGSKKSCRLCKKHRCKELCSDYSEALCDKLCETPYVCNGCDTNNANCRFSRRVYDPAEAHKQATQTKHNKATGYDYTDQELDIINNTISPLILHGQSPYTALVTAKAELSKNNIHISKTTL